MTYAAPRLKPLLFALLLCIVGAGVGHADEKTTKTRSLNWGHYHAFVTEKPPWVEQQWDKLSEEQRRRFEDGFLDVTVYDGWQGNPVDPSGQKDSIKALNHVVGIGRDFDLTVYFPGGTYLISDTLNCRQTAYVRQTSKGRRWISQGSRVHTCKLYGDRKSRPVIRLKDGAAGFDDPDNPKAVVAMWKQRDPENLTDYRQDHPAACYYAIMDGMTIDCGKNPGAIGLYYKGAQGSMVSGVKINAIYAYAGLEGGSWAVGGVYDLYVQGGQYGVIVHGNPPCYVGLTLRNQSEAALKFGEGASGVVTICGFRIEKEKGPALTLPSDGVFKSSVHGNLILMDGSIALINEEGFQETELASPAIDNSAGKNLYLENVYFRGTNLAVKSKLGSSVTAAGRLTRVDQYYHCNQNVRSKDGGWGSLRCPSSCLIDGEMTKKSHMRQKKGAAPPPKNLMSKHLWGDIPEYGDGDPRVRNAVRDLGIDNTGKTPVTAALRKAIGKHERIFLPKGKYLLDGTVTLKAHTQLFGASPNNTQLIQDSNWKPSEETPILITQDNRNGTAFLGNLVIRQRLNPTKDYPMNILTWRVGKKSVVKHVTDRPLDWMEARNTPGAPVSAYRIQGGGGGKWFSSIHEHTSETNDPDFHILTIEDTSEPLTLYHYGGIHARGGDQTVIRNASNVRFIGYNLEPGAIRQNIFHAINSNNIGFYGFGNHTAEHEGTALARFTDCEDVLCAIFSQPKDLRSDNTDAYQVFEARSGQDKGVGVTGDRILCVYKRGDFDFPD